MKIDMTFENFHSVVKFKVTLWDINHNCYTYKRI